MINFNNKINNHRNDYFKENMTSIYQIKFEDIKVFLKANNKCFKNKTDAYNIASKLLKDKNTTDTTNNSITDWIIARNLLLSKVNIPKYSLYEIDFASKDEVNMLANSLTLEENNINNVKKYLKIFREIGRKNNIFT